MSDEMIRAEIAKGPHPKRNWVAIAGSTLGAAVLVVGGVVGVNAVNAYRADIQAMQTSAEDYYDAAAEQVELANTAAEAAAESAVAAEEAVTVVEAEEAAVAAQVAAEAAATAAAAQPAPVSANNNTGKCPAGTAPGQVNADGTESLCAPTGPGGATCAEYNGPTCTSWLKP